MRVKVLLAYVIWHGLVACSVCLYLLTDPLFEKVYMEKVILLSTYNIASIDQEFTDDQGCKEESQGLGFTVRIQQQRKHIASPGMWSGGKP